MNSILDNVLSFIIGGAVMLLLSVLMMNMRSASMTETINTNIQSNLVTVTDIMENDFRKVGYKVPLRPADSSVTYAGKDSLRMKGDLDNNGSVDYVVYYIGRSKPAENVNPRSRYLFRNFNGTVRVMNEGVTQLKFTYYDTLGNVLTASPSVTSPSKINAIKVTLSMESPFPSEITKRDTTYSYATREQTLKPRNLKVN